MRLLGPTSGVLGLACAAALVATAPADTIYVDADCPGPGSGTEGDPYCSIQAAIDNAVDTDEILVAPGTYFECIDFLGRAITLRSSGGPGKAIIDAGTPGCGTVVTCESGEGPDTVLEGFAITGGTGTLFETKPGEFGFVGGGMFNTGGSSPTVTDCTFSLNSAEIGGGMANDTDSSPTVTNCTFSGNSASADGGGMASRNNHPVVTNCVFNGNTAVKFGGGMDYSHSDPTITNCTFTGNSMSGSGGGIALYHGSPTIINSTFTGNSAGSGGAMYSAAADPTVINCILWDDAPEEIVAVDGSVPNVGYSSVQGGWSGTGNIDADPMLVDPGNGDLHLSPGSPCIDSGRSYTVPQDITTDLDGNPRFVDDPNVMNTGFGACPVDMGPYESQQGPACDPCPWDCQESGRGPDGNIGINDFLDVIIQWGMIGTTCDFELGSAGAGIVEFLEVLLNWGPCP